MKEKLFRILVTISIVPLIAVCSFTGGATSPFRFAYLPLMMLISIRLHPRTIFLTGVTFSCSYVVMVVFSKPADSHAMALAVAEFIFYLLTVWAAVSVAKTVNEERNRFRLAESTYSALSNELSNRTMNLQTALDTLSLVHTKLQNIDRNKTAFMGNIAHELRTPLSGIRSYSEILLTYEDLDVPTQREFLEIIQNESVRMSTIVNEMLNLIKIESGNIALVLGKVSCSELIEECVKVMKPMAAAKKLSLESSVSPVSIYIKADKGQVMQVLINLLNNAIKFTQIGGIAVGVTLKEQFAEFFVTDSGEGIFPDEQEKIFDEFYRILDNVPNQPAGTGLGLSICKKIVEFHEGTIGVTSVIGKGSTFRFTIPLFFDEKQSVISSSGEMLIHQHEKFRPILVVIRDTVKRMCLRKSLENVGYSTFGTSSFEKACALIKSSPVDIIVTEINSNMDDIEPLLTLAAAEKTLLYMSYFYTEPPELISLVITGYIWMPFDRHQLLPLLEPLKIPHKKITIVSADMDESRMLQTILGIEGYKTALSSNDDKFIDSCLAFLPEAIIIGTFENDQIDALVKKVRATAKVANVPLILVLREKPNKNAKLVTVPIQGDRPLLFGLSPLVQKIEGDLLK